MTVAFARCCRGRVDATSSAIVGEWGLLVAFLIAGRGAIRLRTKSSTASPTLIVGAGRVGHLLARRLLERPQMGLRPVGFLDADPLDIGQIDGCPVLGSPSQLELLVRANGSSTRS